MYAGASGFWKERGRGSFKINNEKLQNQLKNIQNKLILVYFEAFSNLFWIVF